MKIGLVRTAQVIGAALVLAMTVAACGSASPTATPVRPTATASKGAGTTPTAAPAATATPVPAVPTPTATTVTQAQPKAGGTVKLIYLSAHNLFDTHQSTRATTGGEYWGIIADRLLNYDWRGKGPISGALAESWEYKSNTELIVRLQKGIRFQQQSLAKGREMDSSDVVASFTRMRQTTPPFAWGVQFRKVDKIEAVDKYTVRLTFTSADANFLTLLSNYGSEIIPKETLEKYPDSIAKSEAMYGTGPFVWDDSFYRADNAGAANKNPNYDVVKGQPYLDRVQWVTVLDLSSRTAAVRTGQVDIGTVPALEADAFRKAGFQLGVADKMHATAGLIFNTQMVPTNDSKIRKALAMIIDYEELKLVVADGFGCVAIIIGCWDEYYLGEKDFKGKAGFRDKATDIAEAKALFQAAGFDPKTMTIELVTSQNQYKLYLEQAVAYKAMAERSLGIKVNIRTNDARANAAGGSQVIGVHMNNISAGIGTLHLDIRIRPILHSTGLENTGTWKDAKTDELLDAEAAELDVTKRKALFQQIQTYLMSDDKYPMAPAVRNFDFFAANPKLKEWRTPAFFTAHDIWQFSKAWLER